MKPHLIFLATAAVALAALPLSIAHAEDFSTDVSARWGRRYVGGNTDPFGTSNIAGSSSATYHNIQDTTVIGGALNVPLPSNDGTNDAATIARDTGVIVNTTFAADNSTFYAGTLLGDLSGKNLSVTYKIDIAGKPTGILGKVGHLAPPEKFPWDYKHDTKNSYNPASTS